jgi:hypothetical protein
MAGGMNRRGVDKMTLHERIHGAPHNSARPAVKRCWVTDEHGRQPGLLLEWRRTPAGWQGRVVHPVLTPGGWYVVEDWLPAESLEADL